MTPQVKYNQHNKVCHTLCNNNNAPQNKSDG